MALGTSLWLSGCHFPFCQMTVAVPARLEGQDLRVKRVGVKSLWKLRSPMYCKVCLLANFTATLLSSNKAGAQGTVWWWLNQLINGHEKQWQYIEKMCVKDKCKWNECMWHSPFEDSLCRLPPPRLHLYTWPQLLLQIIFLRTLQGLFLFMNVILTSTLLPPNSDNEKATTTNVLSQLLVCPVQH